MKHIFISYSSQDKAYAEKLSADLQDRGFDVWMDYLSMKGGDRWVRKIHQAVRDAGAMIVIMTPRSDKSKWVENEILLAQKHHVPILPMLLEGEVFDIFLGDQATDVLGGKLPPDKFFTHLAQIQPPKPAGKGEDVTPPDLDKADPITQQISTERNPNQAMIGLSVAFLLLLGFVGGIYALTRSNGERSTPETQIPTEVAQELAIAQIVETLDAQATIEQATLNAESTAAARATEYAAGTQAANEATLTETYKPPTHTPDVTQSIEAYRTEQAATVTQAWIDSWTDTPTATFTPSNTPTFTPTFTSTPTEREIALAKAGAGVQSNTDWTPFEEDFDGVTMVLVPKGCFQMGSGEGRDDEKPVHEQCFEEPFWIDKYEVTNTQFAAFEGEAGLASNWTEPNRPRERITWFEARDFCAKRGMRLPTEAEWEYAARGVESWLYPWGNEFIADNVVYHGNSGSQTAEVGSRPEGASWVGAQDMAGNVWEWVSSIYGDYPYNSEDEGNENSTNVLRGLRGGSWNYANIFLRASNRSWNVPTVEDNVIGWRCVIS